MIYLYLAGKEENLEYQTNELIQEIAVDAVFTEKEGGRDVLNRLRLMLLPGDELNVFHFSSVAASSFELMALLGELAGKDVRFRSLEDYFDTFSKEGRAVASFMEKMSALDNPPEGKGAEESAADETVPEEDSTYHYKCGRKPIEVDDDLFEKITEKWKQGEITARKAMEDLGLKPNTFYRRVKEKAKEFRTEDLVNAAIKLGRDIEATIRGEAQVIKEAADRASESVDKDAFEQKVRDTVETVEAVAAEKAERFEEAVHAAVDAFSEKPEGTEAAVEPVPSEDEIISASVESDPVEAEPVPEEESADAALSEE